DGRRDTPLNGLRSEVAAKAGGFSRRLRQRRILRGLRRRGIHLGRDVSIRLPPRITPGSVRVGDHTVLDGDIYFAGGSTIEIGKFCAIGRVWLLPFQHLDVYPSTQMDLYTKMGFRNVMDDPGPIVIGNDVEIGHQSMI